MASGHVGVHIQRFGPDRSVLTCGRAPLGSSVWVMGDTDLFAGVAALLGEPARTRVLTVHAYRERAHLKPICPWPCPGARDQPLRNTGRSFLGSVSRE
jgi:hypothetical protein